MCVRMCKFRMLSLFHTLTLVEIYMIVWLQLGAMTLIWLTWVSCCRLNLPPRTQSFTPTHIHSFTHKSRPCGSFSCSALKKTRFHDNCKLMHLLISWKHQFGVFGEKKKHYNTSVVLLPDVPHTHTHSHSLKYSERKFLGQGDDGGRRWCVGSPLTWMRDDTLNGFIHVMLKTLLWIIKRPLETSSRSPLHLDYGAVNKPHGDGHTLNALAPLISRHVL